MPEVTQESVAGKKLLLHICCGPCAVYPVELLRQQDAEIMGYYYNPNIHPYTEFQRRQEALAQLAEVKAFRVIYDEEYHLERFLRNIAFREADRCSYCYYDRLRSAALIAKRGKFSGFTTTLLYSKFQKHRLIRAIGESVGKETGIPFFYADFREGWKDGIEKSKEMGLYRQQYCGCIYSERERFYPKHGRHEKRK